MKDKEKFLIKAMVPKNSTVTKQIPKDHWNNSLNTIQKKQMKTTLVKKENIVENNDLKLKIETQRKEKEGIRSILETQNRKKMLEKPIEVKKEVSSEKKILEQWEVWHGKIDLSLENKNTNENNLLEKKNIPLTPGFTESNDPFAKRVKKVQNPEGFKKPHILIIMWLLFFNAREKVKLVMLSLT